MSNEKIKFGDQVFDLVTAGVNLTDRGGSIMFCRGDTAFDVVNQTLKKNGDIVQIGTSGDPDWSRSDLIYAGILTSRSNYEVSTGVKADVMIAEFRTPDTREQIKDTNANLAYLSMMTGYDLEVLTL